MKVYVESLNSPIGQLWIASHENALVRLDFEEEKESFEKRLSERFPGATHASGGPARAAVRALERYFEGDLEALEGIACDGAGTDFQKAVWSQLRKISPGRTASYGEVARAIGRPKAVRAVGAANGQNPIGLVVPCHRVIGSTGDLTGYGGGLERKRWLLSHERALAPAAC
jgi:methylated-DNA-[protein]-cysteine S-methyltransferase